MNDLKLVKLFRDTSLICEFLGITAVFSLLCLVLSFICPEAKSQIISGYTVGQLLLAVFFSAGLVGIKFLNYFENKKPDNAKIKLRPVILEGIFDHSERMDNIRLLRKYISLNEIPGLEDAYDTMVAEQIKRVFNKDVFAQGIEKIRFYFYPPADTLALLLYRSTLFEMLSSIKIDMDCCKITVRKKDEEPKSWPLKGLTQKERPLTIDMGSEELSIDEFIEQVTGFKLEKSIAEILSMLEIGGIAITNGSQTIVYSNNSINSVGITHLGKLAAIGFEPSLGVENMRSVISLYGEMAFEYHSHPSKDGNSSGRPSAEDEKIFLARNEVFKRPIPEIIWHKVKEDSVEEVFNPYSDEFKEIVLPVSVKTQGRNIKLCGHMYIPVTRTKRQKESSSPVEGFDDPRAFEIYEGVRTALEWKKKISSSPVSDAGTGMVLAGYIKDYLTYFNTLLLEKYRYDSNAPFYRRYRSLVPSQPGYGALEETEEFRGGLCLGLSRVLQQWIYKAIISGDIGNTISLKLGGEFRVIHALDQEGNYAVEADIAGKKYQIKGYIIGALAVNPYLGYRGFTAKDSEYYQLIHFAGMTKIAGPDGNEIMKVINDPGWGIPDGLSINDKVEVQGRDISLKGINEREVEDYINKNPELIWLRTASDGRGLVKELKETGFALYGVDAKRAFMFIDWPVEGIIQDRFFRIHHSQQIILRWARSNLSAMARIIMKTEKEIEEDKKRGLGGQEISPLTVTGMYFDKEGRQPIRTLSLNQLNIVQKMIEREYPYSPNTRFFIEIGRRLGLIEEGEDIAQSEWFHRLQVLLNENNRRDFLRGMDETKEIRDRAHFVKNHPSEYVRKQQRSSSPVKKDEKLIKGDILKEFSSLTELNKGNMLSFVKERLSVEIDVDVNGAVEVLERLWDKLIESENRSRVERIFRQLFMRQDIKKAAEDFERLWDKLTGSNASGEILLRLYLSRGDDIDHISMKSAPETEAKKHFKSLFGKIKAVDVQFFYKNVLEECLTGSLRKEYQNHKKTERGKQWVNYFIRRVSSESYIYRLLLGPKEKVELLEFLLNKVINKETGEIDPLIHPIFVEIIFDVMKETGFVYKPERCLTDDLPEITEDVINSLPVVAGKEITKEESKLPLDGRRVKIMFTDGKTDYLKAVTEKEKKRLDNFNAEILVYARLQECRKTGQIEWYNGIISEPMVFNEELAEKGIYMFKVSVKDVDKNALGEDVYTHKDTEGNEYLLFVGCRTMSPKDTKELFNYCRGYTGKKAINHVKTLARFIKHLGIGYRDILSLMHDFSHNVRSYSLNTCPVGLIPDFTNQLKDSNTRGDKTSTVADLNPDHMIKISDVTGVAELFRYTLFQEALLLGQRLRHGRFDLLSSIRQKYKVGIKKSKKELCEFLNEAPKVFCAVLGIDIVEIPESVCKTVAAKVIKEIGKVDSEQSEDEVVGNLGGWNAALPYHILVDYVDVVMISMLKQMLAQGVSGGNKQIKAKGKQEERAVQASKNKGMAYDVANKEEITDSA
ncbi:MAG: hypothetical protein KAR32_12045, partial [Candidatus Omnitrophica bacterium]|nr:hypothetical protein [Candidatus Omnitrophota bacterium]